VRFLADEHVPGSTIQDLRAAGHDVWAAAAEAPGSPDPALLARAVSDERVVLTCDGDFGTLLFHAGATAPPGVVYFPLAVVEPAFLTHIVLALVAGAGQGICGQFTVVDEERIRQRPLMPRPAA
jgi:predicted nuclease of predicted toxin-antitoxin system